MGGQRSKQDKPNSFDFSKALQTFNLCLRPQSQSSQLTQFLKQYNSVSLYTDPYYGQCYALESKETNNYKVMIKETIEKKNYHKRLQVLNQLRSVSQGPTYNVIKTDIVCDIQKTGFINTKNEVYVTHDYILVDLEKEFQNRKLTNNYFSEVQIRTIMQQVVKGFLRLELTTYDAVKMDHIYFCGLNKEIKIAHPKLFEYRSNLQKMGQNYFRKGIYLSPQQLESLQRVDIFANHGWRSNCFTFGMIILGLMMMKEMDAVYDYRACEINFKLVQEYLKEAHSKYSYGVINVVEGLLVKKETNRLGLRNLSAMLDERYQSNNTVEVTLVQPQYHVEQEQQEQLKRQQPQYFNYISSFLYPKVSLNGEYYHSQDDKYQNQYTSIPTSNTPVVANSRLRYSNQMGSFEGQYVGSTQSKTQVRQGRGIYKCPDGQQYIGEWQNSKMEGYGKLYYDDHKLRYEGEFKGGKFNGHGLQYSEYQIEERQEQIDHEYVKMYKGNWIKYDGFFKNDVREGVGKVSFKTGFWKGNFKGGQPNGEGIFYYNDEKKGKVKGLWIDGELQERKSSQQY